MGYNATIAGCDRSCELRVGNLGTMYANLREGCWRRGGGMMREPRGRAEERRARGGLEREREGEGLYRYVPAAVVCNIMITLPACAADAASLFTLLTFSLSFCLFLFLSVYLPSRSFTLSLPFYAYTRLPVGHPLSAAMLPGNMIIVIICTLLRSYPPDSSPLRNSPVILPVWLLPPFALSAFPSFSLFLSPSLAPPQLCHPA